MRRRPRLQYSVLGMMALWTLITALPGSPFVDPDADPEQRFNPLYRSLVAFFAVTFFLDFFCLEIGFEFLTGFLDETRLRDCFFKDFFAI